MKKNLFKSIRTRIINKSPRLYFLFFMFSFSLNAVAQTCNTVSLAATTPFDDFTVHNDGTVSHNKTGLVWQVCSQGQTWDAGACTGTATAHTWQTALQIPQALNTAGGYAGKTDWRLPNIKELASIVELQCVAPAINTTIFPDTVVSLPYWSSSPNTASIEATWGIDFNNGNDGTDLRHHSAYVRLVRGGQ